MGKITAILQAAQQRAKEMNLSYEGALYPDQAYEILQSAPGAKLWMCVPVPSWIGWDACPVPWKSNGQPIRA